MTAPSASAPPVLVLQSLSPPDGTTRYVDQIVDGAPSQVTFRFFSWRTALIGRYDVLHVHWPELLIRAERPAKAFLRRLALRVMILRARVRRIPIVRTLHNLHPHEQGSRSETRAMVALEKHTTLFIRLNPTTPIPRGSEGVTIPHGHYRDRFGRMPLPEPVQGHILYFGLVRPYKGVETLLSVFGSTDRPDLRLRVVGRPSGGLGEIIATHEQHDPRISSLQRFVSDEELVEEIGHSHLVVLPYREMHNSGALLVALSLGRPVLVPRTPSNTALADEVGADWMLLYDGELDRDTLERAVLTSGAAPRASPPRLDGRDWATVGQRTYEAYLRALQLTGRRPKGAR